MTRRRCTSGGLPRRIGWSGSGPRWTDRPAAERYGDWLVGVAHGDFGNSMVEGISLDIAGSGKASGIPVAELIEPRLKNTGILLLATMALLIPHSLLIGTATALMRGGVFDASSQTLMLVFTALPEFTLGAILALVFGVVWPILPAVSLEVSFTTLVLPVATLSLAAIAYTARFIRAGVIEALAADHVQMARMKGLPARLVIRRHVLRMRSGPPSRRSPSSSAGSRGGVVVVEYLFAYPWHGSGLVRAISARDVPVVQAYTLIIAATYIVAANLARTCLRSLLNPRLRRVRDAPRRSAAAG